MRYIVEFAPESEEQILDIYRYISKAASPETANNYTHGIVSYCEELETFPHRGVRRDDIRPKLLVTNYKKRVIIAYTIEDNIISIIGVFYGGQDYETILHEESK